MNKKVLDRFWSKIDKSAGDGACWPWLFGLTSDGYAVYKIPGRGFVYAHRLVCELEGRLKVGSKLWACHKCDNPRCCNPRHIFIGTRMDNIRDMVNKNRQQKGTRHANAKANEKLVKQIRFLVKTKGMTCTDVARMVGLSIVCVWKIANRVSWKHVT